jgi:hypothetical protein
MEARLALRIFSLILDSLPGAQGQEGARRTMCSAQAPEIVRRGTKRARFARPDMNGEVDPTIFPAVSDMQLSA